MKPIPGFKDYFATEDGSIFSCRKSKQLGTALRKLVLAKNKSTGYSQVNLYSHGGQKRRDVHRIIAETFIGPIPDGKQVNHIDGNKINNAVANLEIVTQKENMRHCVDMMAARGKYLGPKNKGAVEMAKSMLAQGYPQRWIAMVLGTSQAAVSRINNGLSYRQWTK